MPRPDRAGARRLLVALVALASALGVAAMVPATSSAFTATIANSSDTATSKARFTCADVFAGSARRDSAYFEYALQEDAGAPTAGDSSPQGNTGTYLGANTKDTVSPRPCRADPGSPYVLDGSSSVISSKYFPPIRGNVSVEIWFKTASRSEKLIGFERERSGTSGNYDKHLYVDSAGLLRFAIYNSDGDTSTATSSAAVDDGQWHQAVATVSPTAGCVLYVDGVAVGANPKTIAEDFGGYWRIGEGNTGGWPAAPQGTSWFTGSVSFAGAYATVLTAAEVRAAYDIGKPASTLDTRQSRVQAQSASAAPSSTGTASAVATPDTSPSPSPSVTASASASPSASATPASTAQDPSAAPAAPATSSGG